MGTLKFQAIEFRRNSRWALGTEYTLMFSAAGNLEIRRAASGTLVWQTDTNGDRLVMQEDGNLVIYDADGGPVWATDSWGYRNAVLLARDDASLEIVSEDGVVVWRAARGSQDSRKATPADAPGPMPEFQSDNSDDRDDWSSEAAS